MKKRQIVLPKVVDEIQGLDDAKANLHGNLELHVDRWRREEKKRFDDWFEQEIVGHSSTLWNAYRKHKPRIDAHRSRFGLQRVSYSAHPAADLMMRVLERLEDAGWPTDECLVKCDEFFASKVFRQVPLVWIGSALWAGLAHGLVHAGWKDWSESFGNDVTFISAYLPYCDAMFVDKRCANILKNKPVTEIVPEGVRVYSTATRDEFLDFLKQIESTASMKHHQKIREVYGEEWITSSVGFRACPVLSRAALRARERQNPRRHAAGDALVRIGCKAGTGVRCGASGIHCGEDRA